MSQKYGHFKYAETDVADLVEVGMHRDSGRMVSLRREASMAFLKMSDASAEAGVRLIPISGFRDVNHQEKLFQRAIDKRGSAAEAARWVAPAGYSEHHTGLALDIGDGDVPDADVEERFETTSAFNWLEQHAPDFGFELSFPKGNEQGVSYEPWHWRFIGNAECLTVFTEARIHFQVTT